MNIKKFFSSFFHHLKSLFLRGLFTILPVILTIFAIAFTYDTIVKWLQPLRKLEPEYLQKIPGSEIIIVTLFLLLLGFLLKLVFITPIVHWIERMLNKIPFIRTVYSSSKTVVDFFKIKGPGTKGKKVVLVEFPRKGVFNIGFMLEPITGNFEKIIPPEKLASGKTYYKIFMPNSPTPMTGYFFIMSEDDIIPTDLTFDEAIKSIVSCGLITPQSILKK